MKKILIAFIAIIVLGSVAWFILQKKEITPQHCGGFIQNAPTCSAGYHCQLNISNPDTGGICVAN